ncbi:MAG TPA: FAD/NAD(P)-binding protein, partial [Candidatus Acidoferrales bacterium]|nr:FAD/NAD(P)-binding protein [Candidatus Acidoferrales bacterium]
MASELEQRTPAAAIDPMVPRLFRIERVRQDTHDTFTMYLAPDGGFSFAPGQFNMLYVFGVGEAPISISSDPSEKSEFQHTTRVVGPVTAALHRLKKGDTVGIRGPFGSPWPVTQAEGHDCLIAAGGIGLAPLRPIIYTVLANRPKYRRVVILYGTRTPEDILYGNELKRWGAKFDLDVHVTVDRGVHDWRGNVGVVTALISRAAFNPETVVAMLCGPEVMMRFSLLEL